MFRSCRESPFLFSAVRLLPEASSGPSEGLLAWVRMGFERGPDMAPKCFIMNALRWTAGEGAGGVDRREAYGPKQGLAKQAQEGSEDGGESLECGVGQDESVDEGDSAHGAGAGAGRTGGVGVTRTELAACAIHQNMALRAKV